MAKANVSLAKINQPHLPEIVSRQRLYSLLDTGRKCSIIWITGPPGAGKTTLVADYLDTFALDSIWYQLDQGDNDIATYFYYMSQALVNTDNNTEKSLPPFTPEYLGDLPAFSHKFFRQLFGQLNTPFAVVFDNYHDLPEQSSLHDVLRNGLEEIPDEGCVIFISRLDPPSSMARFQANGKLKVLSWDDLKLTRDESDAIVQLRGYKFSNKALQKLYKRTQGWSAGLILMLETMRGKENIVEIPDSFTPKVIFDYLAGEIFKNYDEKNRNFLIRTAYLPQITVPMAADLIENEEVASILSYLHEHNYLISASVSGSGEIIYQYHPLLREFLLNQAAKILNADERVLLQTKAATLLEEAGQIEYAIQLRIESRNWDDLARLIKDNAASIMEHGRGETLEQWLDELPGNILDKDPWLVHWLGACKLAQAPRESRRLYEQAYFLFKKQERPDLEGLFESCAGVFYSVLYDLDDLTLLDSWIKEVEQLLVAYPDFPTKEYGARTTYIMYLGLVLRQTYHNDIEVWAERTFNIMRSSKNQTVRIQSAINLVSGIVWTGRFAQALEIIEIIRVEASSPNVSPVTLTQLRHMESMYYMVAGEYDFCLKTVRDGIEIANSSGVHIWTNSLLINGAGGALGAGDLTTAQELLDQLDRKAMSKRSFDSCMFNYFSAWHSMLKNNLRDAYNHQLSALRQATEMGLTFVQVLCQLGLAQLLFACGDARKGTYHLRQLRKRAKNIKNHLLEFMCFLIYAQIALDHGRRASGLRSLKYALSIGREYNFAYIIWMKPEDMAHLIEVALENNIETDYAIRLITQRNLIPSKASLTIENWPWPFRVYTLGHFFLKKNNEQNELRSKGQGRPIELLKVLIAFGGKSVSIDRITDAMWPRIEADYSHRSFNTTLHRLRKLLGNEQAILLNSGKLSINEKYFWLDTWVFDQEIDELNLFLKRPDHLSEKNKIMELAEKILHLYQGPFLADEEESWIIATRDHWKNKFIRFVGDVVCYLKNIKREEDAIKFLHQAIEVDELAEGLYRQLMICYKELDRKAEAIEIYNRFKKILYTKFDIEPSDETKQVYKNIEK